MNKGEIIDQNNPPIDDVQSLVHELQAHKIELEMQNEELRRAQKELEDARNRYYDLYDSSPDAIMLLDEKGFFDCNKTTLQIFGFSSKEDFIKVHPSHVSPLYQPDGVDSLTSANNKIAEAFRTGLNHFEWVHRKKNGKDFHADVLLKAFDFKGKQVLQATVRDITESKLSESALKESEERYRSLVNSSPYGIAIHSEGIFKYMNPAGANILGSSSPDQFIGKKVFDVIHPDYYDIARERIQMQEMGKTAPPIEEVFVKVDGTFVDVEITSIPFTYNGKSAMYGVFNDITERKKAEEKITQSLNEKEVLLREIHHRVKNNMQIISSLLNLQMEYIKDKNIIDIFSESQNRIISMALVHEKLYKSSDLRNIDFKGYINDLGANLFQSYNAYHITLNTNVEDMSLDIDLAVPAGLIINELVTNSIKYAFPNGTNGEINISFRKISEDMLELAVSDNGIGLPKDFDFRNTKTLGLNLVTSLAEGQLNGKMDINRNKGTEFIFKFKGIK